MKLRTQPTWQWSLRSIRVLREKPSFPTLWPSLLFGWIIIACSRCSCRHDANLAAANNKCLKEPVIISYFNLSLLLLIAHLIQKDLSKHYTVSYQNNAFFLSLIYTVGIFFEQCTMLALWEGPEYFGNACNMSRLIIMIHKSAAVIMKN